MGHVYPADIDPGSCSSRSLGLPPSPPRINDLSTPQDILKYVSRPTNPELARCIAITVLEGIPFFFFFFLEPTTLTRPIYIFFFLLFPFFSILVFASSHFIDFDTIGGNKRFFFLSSRKGKIRRYRV